MKLKQLSARQNLSIIAITLIPFLFIASMVAYVTDYKHLSYTFKKSSIELLETESGTFVDDQVLDPSASCIDYNISMENAGTETCYLFIEFDSPTVEGTSILQPSAGAGWELYMDEEKNIDGEVYKSYVFSYGSGGSMTEIDSGGKTSQVFGTVAVARLSDEQYATIENTTSHVFARAVMAGDSNGNVDTAWSEVPKRTD